VAWSTKWLVVDAHAFAPERDRDDPTPCPSLRVRPLQRHSADASSSARDREHSVDVRDPRITPNDGSRAGRQRCVDSATTNGVCAVATRICRSRAPLEVRDQRRTRAQIVGADRLRLKRSDRRLGISATGEEWAGVHPTTRARRPAIQNNAGGTGARLTRMLPRAWSLVRPDLCAEATYCGRRSRRVRCSSRRDSRADATTRQRRIRGRGALDGWREHEVWVDADEVDLIAVGK
jgi:hypothetical protein